jgi:hypothetical protein|tara:strand:- start:714 stop:890 length:177 start_codon:yes stop_codon:yes gene_type:complete
VKTNYFVGLGKTANVINGFVFGVAAADLTCVVVIKIKNGFIIGGKTETIHLINPMIIL